MRDQLGAPYADAQSVMTLIYEYSGSGDFVGGVGILTVMRSCSLVFRHGVWAGWASQRDTHYAAWRCLIITRCLSIMIFPKGFPSLIYLETSHSKLNDLVDAGYSISTCQAERSHNTCRSLLRPPEAQTESSTPKAADSLINSSLSSSLYCLHSLQYGFHH